MHSRLITTWRLPWFVWLAAVACIGCACSSEAQQMNALQTCFEAIAHRYPTYDDIYLNIGNEFGTNRGDALVVLPDGSGVLQNLQSGGGGNWSACDLVYSLPVSPEVVEDDLRSTSYALHARSGNPTPESYFPASIGVPDDPGG